MSTRTSVSRSRRGGTVETHRCKSSCFLRVCDTPKIAARARAECGFGCRIPLPRIPQSVVPRRSGWRGQSGRRTRSLPVNWGTTQTLRLWLKHADQDEGKRRDGLTSDEQEELRRLRRENRIVRE